MASSSSFFMNLLYKNPSTSLIYLAGVKFRDLVSILDFMYCGKVGLAELGYGNQNIYTFFNYC